MILLILSKYYFLQQRYHIKWKKITVKENIVADQLEAQNTVGGVTFGGSTDLYYMCRL